MKRRTFLGTLASLAFSLTILAGTVAAIEPPLPPIIGIVGYDTTGHWRVLRIADGVYRCEYTAVPFS